MASNEVNQLNAAYVTRDNALGFCNGRFSAPELWASPFGPVLFINGLRGPLAWRQLAILIETLPPQGIVFRTRVPSLIKRAQKFGARLMAAEDGNFTYFAEGAALRAFLDALCRQRGEQSCALS